MDHREGAWGVGEGTCGLGTEPTLGARGWAGEGQEVWRRGQDLAQEKERALFLCRAGLAMSTILVQDRIHGARGVVDDVLGGLAVGRPDEGIPRAVDEEERHGPDVENGRAEGVSCRIDGEPALYVVRVPTLALEPSPEEASAACLRCS